ncbi:M28 family peptidase [Nocardioides sp. YIM 152315]|uniref:M28 family metallopeptidase n=1 Tax=Nocardioides sp. YIM 152315 TaxID=3031760 RepID=UPI0023DA7BBA|nr:M28 family peptidase [Nocardioides sp. YIM 152315]MDF1604354.1 M28 family peptidase [Nocardioides sp. YIM 152315]
MRVVAIVLAVVVLGGCSGDPVEPRQPVSTTPAPTTAPTTAPPSGTATPAPPARFDATRAMRTVRHLAGRIGPRLATGPAFREAAAWVADGLAAQGYAVRRQSFPLPAGDSWGVPVRAGRSSNVIATPRDFDPVAPYALVGAHLDTVAVAPGAEDNASGVAVLLELARVLGGTGQVVLVAFGGEEPRGPGELHHFGSKRYVAALAPAVGRQLRAMVSLDRVGVGSVVPLSSVEGTPSALRDRLARVAEREGIPTVVETDSASDHESFADAGFVAARIGSTPYAGYHSAADAPAVVDPAQLRRVGRLLTAWVSAALRAS